MKYCIFGEKQTLRGGGFFVSFQREHLVAVATGPDMAIPGKPETTYTMICVVDADSEDAALDKFMAQITRPPDLPRGDRVHVGTVKV